MTDLSRVHVKTLLISIAFSYPPIFGIWTMCTPVRSATQITLEEERKRQSVQNIFFVKDTFFLTLST